MPSSSCSSSQWLSPSFLIVKIIIVIFIPKWLTDADRVRNQRTPTPSHNATCASSMHPPPCRSLTGLEGLAKVLHGPMGILGKASGGWRYKTPQPNPNTKASWSFFARCRVCYEDSKIIYHLSTFWYPLQSSIHVLFLCFPLGAASFLCRWASPYAKLLWTLAARRHAALHRGGVGWSWAFWHLDCDENGWMGWHLRCLGFAFGCFGWKLMFGSLMFLGCDVAKVVSWKKCGKRWWFWKIPSIDCDGWYCF